MYLMTILDIPPYYSIYAITQCNVLYTYVFIIVAYAMSCDYDN